MPFAARELVDQEEALEHRHYVAVAHQRAGDPDASVELDAVLGGKRCDLGTNAHALAKVAEEFVRSRGIDQRRPALLRQFVAFDIGFVEHRSVVQSLDLNDFHAHRRDNRTRVLVHNALGSARKLDAVAVHDEGDRRSVDGGTVEAVERLTRDIASVATVADDPAALAALSPLAEGLAYGHRNHHPQAAAVELSAARQPRHVPGSIEPAAKTLDDDLLIDKTQRRQCRVVTHRGVGVFDGVFDALVVGDSQGQQERRNQL